MKKIGLITIGFAFLFQNFSFAGPTYQWSIPDNIRIVQSTAVDNVRVFSTIQSAINSITNASSTNPYQIKVMPGTYSTQFTLPSYVSLTGSDKESTIINVPIVINGNTAVEGIKFLSNAISIPLVTVNDGSIVELRNVAITVGPDSSTRALLTGTASVVTLINADIYIDQNNAVDPNSNIDNIIMIGDGGTLEIKNSDVNVNFYRNNHGYSLYTLGGANIVIDNTRFRSANKFAASELIDGRPENFMIINSLIELEAEDGIYGIDNAVNLKILGSKIIANSKYNGRSIEAVHCWLSNVQIDNSVIVATLNGNPSTNAVSIAIESSNVEINNSNLSGPVTVSAMWSTPELKVGNSKIGGGIIYNANSEYGIYKFFGCHDDNYQACEYPPIP